MSECAEVTTWVVKDELLPRVVAAAVLGVEYEREVERLGLELRVLPVLAHEHQQRFGRRLRWVGVANHQRPAVMVVGLRLVCVGDDRRNGADEVHRLFKALVERQVVGRPLGVERIREKYGAGEGVHDVLRRVLHDRVFLESVGKLPVLADALLPVDELPRGG